jgi:hypothetical protein
LKAQLWKDKATRVSGECPPRTLKVRMDDEIGGIATCAAYGNGRPIDG